MAKRLDIRKSPFAALVVASPHLKELRAHYAAASVDTRRNAAAFAHTDGMVAQMFRDLAPDFPSSDDITGTIEALAIDPDFAPAVLGVGSIEYQVGRPAEAMKHFLHLTELPAATEDLHEIIDKAGRFLTDCGDMERAERLCRAAVHAFPDAGLHHSGLGYCAAKLGRKPEALAHARKAVELEPDNAVFLSDLGWALIECQLFTEADACLRQAIALAPGQTMAEGNLEYLRKLQTS